MNEFSVQHRPERLGGLYRALASRSVGGLRRGAWGVFVVCVFGMVFTASLGWPWVAVAACALTLAAGLDVLREQQIATALALLEAIGPQGLRYRVDGAGMAESSVLSEVHMPWTSFTGRRELAGYLVLERVPARAGLIVALPLDQVPAEARLAIEAQVPQAAPSKP
jgi:hypothetical protein